MTILPGGPNANHRLSLIAGRIEFYMSANTLQAFDAVSQNIPTVSVAAIFQKDPQVLIAHPGSGFDSFEKLQGRILLIGAGGRVTYWPFLRKKYGLKDEQLRPYNFQMAPFLANPNAVQQGFLSSEPYSIAQALGREPEVMLIADAGFSAYQTTIAISRKLAQEKKDLVQRFVDATLEGWAQYLRGGAATDAANAMIKRDNPDQTDDRIAYAIKVLNQRGIVMSGDALTGGIGAYALGVDQQLHAEAEKQHSGQPGNHRLGMMSMLSADNANITARDIVSFLKQIRRNISGPLLIVWDKGTVHDRSKDVRDYLAKHPEIHTERFPSYAPELNPVELIWSTTKYGRMANFTPVNTNQLRSRLCEEMARLRNRKDLLASFIQHALPDLRLWG